MGTWLRTGVQAQAALGVTKETSPQPVLQGQRACEASPPSCVDGGWWPHPDRRDSSCVCVFEGLGHGHGRENKGEEAPWEESG